MTLDPPEWLILYIRSWQERLYLEHWTVKVGLALCVNNDADVHALCEQTPDINEACLTFRADIENTPDWRKTIIHELLHVAHARVDHYVERAVFPELPEQVRQMATEVYHQQIESFVELMDRTLYRATCGIDYPDEHKDAANEPDAATA